MSSIQDEEREALAAIYAEDFVSETESTWKVILRASGGPLSAALLFTLPQDYPTVPPNLNISLYESPSFVASSAFASDVTLNYPVQIATMTSAANKILRERANDGAPAIYDACAEVSPILSDLNIEREEIAAAEAAEARARREHEREQRRKLKAENASSSSSSSSSFSSSATTASVSASSSPSEDGMPPLLLDISVQTTRFHEVVASTIELHGLCIAVGGGEGEHVTHKKDLLVDADLILANGTKYALIGRNGCGKSIFLKVVASGEIFDPDSQINLRIQLVTQNFAPPPSKDWTVEEELNVPPFGYDLSGALDASKRAERRSVLRSGTRGKQAREQALLLATAAVSGDEGTSTSSSVSGNPQAPPRGVSDDVAFADDPPSMAEIAEAFDVLQIPIAMLKEKYETLSGGWRMRIVLAKTLLYKPQILLLDEPTNHLDILGINQVVHLLKSDHFADMTIIFVSHDLYFVNEVAESCIQMQDGKLIVAKGNWDSLNREREDRKKFTERYAAAQEKQQEKLLSSIETSLRNAGKDDKLKKQLAGRREKALERGVGMMRNSKGHRFRKHDAENAGYHLTLLNDVEQVREERPVHFHFSPPAIGRGMKGVAGEPLLEADGLRFAYSNNNRTSSSASSASSGFSLYLKDLNVTVGERVVLLGANGHGKSTLLKLLVGDLRADAGEVKIHAPQVGYFEQHAVDRLGAETRTAVEYVMDTRRKEGKNLADGEEEYVKKWLGSFGLGPYGDVPVMLLSGGQRVALEMVVVALRKPMLLILDEPNAHLDLQARTGLGNALAEFEGGGVIFISHDIGFVELVQPTKALICDGGRFRTVMEGEEWRELVMG